jgi:hypothetical protein
MVAAKIQHSAFGLTAITFFNFFLTVLSVSRLYSADDTMTDKYGAVEGMRIYKETEALRENLPVPLCPPQISHDLT